MKYELKPMNKHIVLEPLKEDERVGGGLLFAPGNALEKQYKLGKVVAVGVQEVGHEVWTGDVVLYDSIGSVSHRVGNQSFTTVKALNILAVVKTLAEGADELTKAIVEGHS